ncbi:MAG: CapA family protein [Anaerolineaceae bacterium]|nr:CapA family protein [Anaerolineaceae bacterium]
MKQFIALLYLAVLLSILCGACAPIEGEPYTASEVPVQDSTESPPLNLSSPTPEAPNIWIDPLIPDPIRAVWSFPSNWQVSDAGQNSTFHIDLNGNGAPIGSWVFVLVAPFPTLERGISSELLQSIWRSGSAAAHPFDRLLLTEPAAAALSRLWGSPNPNIIDILPADQMLDTAWDDPAFRTWALIPFEMLQIEWKVIPIDGSSPLAVSYSTDTDPLSIPITINGEPQVSLPYASNFDPGRRTLINLTGTTALVRATAATMRTRGITYPAEDILSYLLEADITHVSNEIAFSPDCPVPAYQQDDLRFCSNPEYIELLQWMDADVIELSGDHLEDWGFDAFVYTIDLYDQYQFDTYAAGRTLEEARAPLILTHNQNQVAFIGCNAKSPAYARASDERPGVAFCDFDWLVNEVSALRAEGILPIVTLQHEEFYQYEPVQKIITDFQRLADAGAVIISGSQGHQPHGMEIINGSFLHYGLGNLFFDQINESDAQKKSFIDRYVIYDNSLVSVELYPMIFVDYAKPRPMTDDEWRQLAQDVFSASNWR